MASGYNITQVDVPGILGLYQNTQDRRVQQMLLQRRIAAEDRDLARTESMSKIYSNLVIPGQAGDQPKGGDPSSGGMSGAYAAPSTPVAPSAPLATQPGAVAPIASAPWAPASDDPSPAAAAPTAATPGAAATAKQSAPLTTGDHGWLASNAGAIQQLMGLDYKEGMALYAHLKSMDDDQRKVLVDGQDALHTLAAAVQKLPYGERRAAIAESAPELMRAHPGVTPQMVQEFDPTDQNIQKAIGVSLGIKGMADQAEKAKQRDVTREGNYLQAGFLPPGVDAPAVGATGGLGGDTFGRMLTAESGGKQFGADGKTITSPKGAVGIAQVMPGTGPMAAKAAGLPWDPVRFQNDAQYNQTIGRAYYNSLVEHYGGDEAKAVAAYNAGPGRVDAAITKKGAGWVSNLPRETRNYLAKVNPQGAPSAGLRPIPGGKLDRKDAPSGYQWTANGTLAPIPGGPADKGGRAQLKPIPQSAVKVIVDNRSTLRQIDSAIALLGGDKEFGIPADPHAHGSAIGWGTGSLGDWYTNNVGDPAGVETRAAIGKIGGQIIHDVSGAAVTLSEEPRFKPYVPTIKDNATVALQKLKNLRRLAQGTNDDYMEQYSEEQGYRPFAGGKAQQAAPVRIANAADYASLPSGAHYIDPQGTPRVKK